MAMEADAPPSSGGDRVAKDLRKALNRALLSVCLNLFLAVSKGIAGALSGSTALIGDALHSAVDVFSSAAAGAGLWLSGKEHPSFPFGLYKAESIATLVISIFVVLAAYETGRGALLSPAPIPDVGIAFPVALASFFITIGFGLYQLRNGRRLYSPALIADAKDYLADAASTGVVVLGLAAAHYGYAVERYAAGFVSIFVLWSGIGLLVGAVRDLLDAAVDPEMRDQFIALAMEHPQVRKVERCIGRRAGGRMLVNMDVLLRTDSHERADKVADRLEEAVMEAYPRVVMVHIRTHFGHNETVRRITPLTSREDRRAVGLVHACWFLVEEFDAESGEAVSEKLERNPSADAKRKKGFRTAKRILELNPDIVSVPRRTQGSAFLLLDEAGVKVEEVGPSDVVTTEACAEKAAKKSSFSLPFLQSKDEK
jgi:cation diffusion facilitator family transporter